MKPIYFLAFVVFTGTSCKNNSNSKEVKDSLPGSYTFNAKDEISDASDTITISPYNNDANTFIVIKTTGFNRFIDGKKMPREFKRQEMNAIYDEQTMQLRETKAGKIFSFKPDRNELLFGSAIYQKIK